MATAIAEAPNQRWITKQLYWLKEVCIPGDLNNEHTVFNSVTDDWPFQDHLLSKTIGLKSAVSKETWTMKIHVQIQFTYSEHVSQKANKMQFLFTMLLPYMCQLQNMPSNATSPNYLTCINGVHMPMYMLHMNSLAQTIDGEHST